MAKSRMDVTAFVGKPLKEDDAGVLKKGVQMLSQAVDFRGYGGPMSGLRFGREDSPSTAKVSSPSLYSSLSTCTTSPTEEKRLLDERSRRSSGLSEVPRVCSVR